ncbi:MAG TPA: efflux RND transporter periplasmic adaptor subunit [Mesorhizobium sp.]|jgi:RND family efflux transporter MFP subunit|nr:efflux RND transporter periplasmic adaptor subunit [Mesorhizobium sp.]
MTIVKQLLISLLVLAAAFAAWVRFVPGAPDTLASWGVDPVWVAALAPPEAPSDATAQGGPQPGGMGRRGGRGGPPMAVVVEPVVQATINDRLQAIGTGRAAASVTVQPFGAGRITAVEVESGERVEADTVLLRLDSEAEEIALDRARIARDDAEARLERITALRRSNTVTAVEQAEAEVALRNAELAVREAEVALERRTVVSPIAGIVGIVPVEVGNRVTAETAVATVDDRSSLVVDFWVPERFANAIEVGAPVTAEAVARPGEVSEGTVSAVDNRIDQASRTLQVQARIGNPDDRLRAGQSFQVSMSFPGDTFPAVDPLAVQWGSDGAFVWAVREGRGERVPVRIVQRNTENVLVDGQLTPEEMVVTQGVHAVRQGAEVLIAEQAPPAAVPVSAVPAETAAPAAPADRL